MKVCSVENCDRKYHAKGYCYRHYYRVSKNLNIDGIRLSLRQKHKSEYNSWVSMRQRCNDKNFAKYNNYGGRGIAIFDGWNSKNGFASFYVYIGNKPTPRHSLDRIDNDGNYEPGNVRWSTFEEQNNNRRILKTNKSGYNGVSWNNKERKWKVTAYSNGKQYYIGSYKELDDAIEIRKQIDSIR